MKLTENIEAINFNDNTNKKVIEEIVQDRIITVKINNKIIRRFSVIEDSLKEFIIGYLFGEGYITSLKEINDVTIDKNTIIVNLKNNIKKEETILCSDASGGERKVINKISKVESKLQVNSEELIMGMKELTKNADVWKKTGGTHVAGIVYNDQFIVKEDVSRHVAVDKVIGAALLNNFDLNNSYIIFSGRMPQDMVLKLVRAKIPILASNAAPTASGVQIAKKGNITLVGFLRGKRFNVYNNQNRILF